MKADVCGEGDREGPRPRQTLQGQGGSGAPPPCFYLVWEEEPSAITSRPHGPGHRLLSGRGGTIPNHSLVLSSPGRESRS